MLLEIISFTIIGICSTTFVFLVCNDRFLVRYLRHVRQCDRHHVRHHDRDDDIMLSLLCDDE